MGLGDLTKGAGAGYLGFATGTGLLGAGVASGVMNGLSPGAPPQHQTAGLDSQSSQMIQDQRNRANMSPDDIVNERMQGVDQGAELGRASQDASMRNPGANGASGDDEGLRQALSNRSRRSYSSDLSQIRRNTENQATDIKARYAQQAYENLANQQRVMSGIARKKQAEKEANDQMRRQVINSVIGIGGTIAGAALGGPMGAKAGSSIGGGTTSTASGSGIKGAGSTPTAGNY